ncbi:MAG: biotin--[Odoribacter sp.]|nr:biotin--[acetyl-CoA-carboxylase] ligase [Odoribacter sp.]
MIFNYIELPEAASTNSVAASGNFASNSVIFTMCQTAGRGCGKNSWESEPGKNIAMTLIIGDIGVAVQSQFAISMAVALGCYDYVSQYVDGCSVKWPNDIYVGDRKIAGILIEHSVAGTTLSRSLCGVGLNINQEVFCSDAPNPVSLKQLTGIDYDVRSELHKLVEAIALRLLCASDYNALRNDFMAHLYRNGGLYGWRDSDGEFVAAIHGVDDYGRLQLLLSDGNIRTYGFKEIRYIGAPNSFDK